MGPPAVPGPADSSLILYLLPLVVPKTLCWSSPASPLSGEKHGRPCLDRLAIGLMFAIAMWAFPFESQAKQLLFTDVDDL